VTAQDQELMSRWVALGQQHLFVHWNARSSRRRRRLLGDLATLQPELYSTLQGALHTPPGRARDLQPVGFLSREQWLGSRETRQVGEQLLAEGRAGFLTVAGGQASRLGVRGPKGCFPVSMIRRASLFQIFAEKLLACRRRYARPLSWCIMTSPLNREATVAFFREHGFFGIPEQEILFFSQSLYPTLDPQRRLLLAENGGLLENPNGHGGVIEGLRESALVDALAQRGVQELFYFQVDNPLVRVPDPSFLGNHRLRDSEMSSKVVAKAFPQEKLGCIGRIDGRPGVIEYSDVDPHRMQARDEEGRLLFSHGSIAVHILSLGFLARGSLQLPLHVARKRVHTLVPTPRGGRLEEMEALKFEKFIFDAIPMARNPQFCETTREEEFAPLKNRSGVDSITTCRRGLEEQHARWLEQAGVAVPRRRGRPLHRLEISPLFAVDAESLKNRLQSSVNRIDEDTLLA
jgi:UDP-N-acetylglucosamine/UDP-N-acetylgalactosamine diphosphorylase